MKASSLGRHLADVHDIYQQTVIAEELLETRPPVLYTVNVRLRIGALACITNPSKDGSKLEKANFNFAK